MKWANGRDLHRWIAVSTGTFLLVWIGTGMIMMIPVEELRGWIPGCAVSSGDHFEAGDRLAGSTPAAALFRGATVSVAEAIAVVEREAGAPVDVRRVSLERLIDRVVYDVELANDGHWLIDASSAEPLTITQRVAEEIALEAVPDADRIAGSRRLDEPDYFYEGDLPVYRVDIDNRAGSSVYVSEITGRIERIHSSWSRLHETVIGLHTFKPLSALAAGVGLQLWTLMLVSAAAIMTVATGFYLAIPARARRVFRPRGQPSSNPGR